MAILITMSCGAFSQRTDTICVSRPDLVRKLQQLEDYKVLAFEAEQLRDRNKDLVILLSVRDLRIENYEAQAFNLTRQIRLKDDTIEHLNKSLKKQRLKTFAAGLGGIILTISATLLFHQ